MTTLGIHAPADEPFHLFSVKDAGKGLAGLRHGQAPSLMAAHEEARGVCNDAFRLLGHRHITGREYSRHFVAIIQVFRRRNKVA